ncbi:MAG: MOSC domain-containing protein [Gemmatimonadaceae bacterium]
MASTPPAAPRILSVNIGAIREIEFRGRLYTTGIWKSPVEERVALRGVNFVGDDQADRTVHGGPDKAVYAYAREDYDFWREREAMETVPGYFGENLTVEGINLSDALYGERWSVGSAVLEVAQPRLPCFKLGIRVGDGTFLRRFMNAKRPGAYFRIIEEGNIGAGDEVRVIDKPTHHITLRFMVEALDDPEKAFALRQLRGLPGFWQRVSESADEV